MNQSTPLDVEDRSESMVRTGRPPLWRRLLTGQAARVFVVLLVLLAIFSVLAPGTFNSVANLRNIAVDASVLLVLAVGATFVIITAGVDLSVNGVLIFAGVVAAKVMIAVGGNGLATILLGLVAALVSGLAWGVLNGVIVAKARVPPLITTLGTLGMSTGAALLLTGGVDIRGVPMALVTTVGAGRIGGVPWLVIIAVAVAVVGGVVLAQTRFGRYTFAVGSNSEALRRAGVNTAQHLVRVYALAGTLAGLAGYLSLARFATTTLGGHATDNLQTIASVVLGGTSLFGGVGGMFGTVIGVLIPAALQNGFVVIDVQPFWQQLAVGAVLILAVWADQLRRRARKRG